MSSDSDDRIAALMAAFETGEPLEAFESLIEAMTIRANRKFYRKDKERKGDAYCDVLILRANGFPDDEIPAALCCVYSFPITVARDKVAGKDVTRETKRTGRAKHDGMTELQRFERLRLFKK